jgi:hypothetical protein
MSTIYFCFHGQHGLSALALCRPSRNIPTVWFDLSTYIQTPQLYRDLLFDADVGLRCHVTPGSWSDNTYWAMGNVWVVAGALRVLSTIRGSHVADLMQSQQDKGLLLKQVFTFSMSSP